MFYLHEVSKVVRFIETERTMVVTRSCGKRGLGSYQLMGMEFQFGKMENLWKGMVRMVVRQCECTYCH